MNATSMRLAYRLLRFETITFVSFILALAIAAFVVAGWIDATGYGGHLCMANVATGPLPASCEALSATFYDLQNRLALPIAGLLLFLSYAAAALVGVAVIGREIERGTTRLAWSLAPSRRRWYAARVLPALVVLTGLTFVAGVAADRIAAATIPAEDMGRSFTEFGQRGVLVAARCVFVFALAVAIGAAVGRTLPALILAAIVAGAGLAGGTNIHGRILASEAIMVPQEQTRPGDLYFDQRFQLPDGSLVGWDVMEQLDPPQDSAEWIPKYPMVAIIVPGERYRSVEARETVALAGGSLLALGFGAFVVGRRRPD